MAESGSAPYSGPLSPEEKAECDRELAEMRRKFFEDLDKDLDDYIRECTEWDFERDFELRTIGGMSPAMAKRLRGRVPKHAS